MFIRRNDGREKSVEELLYAYLAKRGRGRVAQGSLSAIAGDLGKSRSTITRALFSLSKQGKVLTSPITRGRGARFYYTVV
jgi:DNA-binding MarR family transcriptional regulator